jgi:hypothetical protein
MKPTIFAAVAILASAAPALAQDTNTNRTNAPATTAPDSMGNYYTEVNKSDLLASNIMGARVYATTKDFDASAEFNQPAADWDDIGEVNNIVIGKGGQVQAVVLGVGGFLSLGEKNVAVPLKQLQFVKRTGDADEEFYIVVKSDKASLEKAPTWQNPTNM